MLYDKLSRAQFQRFDLLYSSSQLPIASKVVMGALLHRLREMGILIEKQVLPSLSAQTCLAARKDCCQVCCSPFPVPAMLALDGRLTDTFEHLSTVFVDRHLTLETQIGL
jgi:hypothetical protein